MMNTKHGSSRHKRWVAAGAEGLGNTCDNTQDTNCYEDLGSIAEDKKNEDSEGGNNSNGGGNSGGNGGSNSGGNGGGCTNGESCYTACQAIQGAISPCNAVCQIYNSPNSTDCDSRQLDACGQR